MAILIDKSTSLIVQGITGDAGLRHALACREYGTKVVGGVAPGKGGTSREGLPVFETALEARNATGANASIIFVPPAAAADSILEALDAGIELVVCVTEGIPVQDMISVKRVLSDYPKSRLVGPNCPGIISPGLAKVGIMEASIHMPGNIGVLSRSGTLMYEAVSQLKTMGFGESTCVGIGGDPVLGTSFVDVLALFEADPETDAVLLIGEIGGEEEEAAAAFLKSRMTKPMAAYIAGRSAPMGKRMGHAGAIAGSTTGSALGKMEALRIAGAVVAEDPASIGQAVRTALSRKRGCEV